MVGTSNVCRSRLLQMEQENRWHAVCFMLQLQRSEGSMSQAAW
jgi:hypothetical protein